MAGISLAHGNLDAFVSNSNNVVKFKLIRKEEDVEDESIEFAPGFTHQIFGESESIFGYKGLKIDIYYTASRLVPFVRMSYAAVANPSKSDDIKPDNVLKIISEKLEMPLPTNIDTFVASLSKESTFQPPGKMINSFKVQSESGSENVYGVYRGDMSVNTFREYHQYMQSFIMWFVDAASYIDVDDDRWEYFLIYEHGFDCGDPRYYFIGYATVYRYYAYPTKLRPRISQMLILPLFQKQGLGAELLQTIYDWYICDCDVLDITVEDPSENFTRLRDYVDCKNCQNLPSYQKNEVLKGFSIDMYKEAQEKFKICKKQARRVYEILRLRFTNIANKNEYRTFRLEVKKRLNGPFQRQKLDMEKLKKTLSPEEFTATVNCMTTEQRIEQLQRIYKELEAEYNHVIERLSV